MRTKIPTYLVTNCFCEYNLQTANKNMYVQFRSQGE